MIWTRRIVPLLLLAASAAGGLACGDAEFIDADALPLPTGATVAESQGVVGAAGPHRINVLAITGPRTMSGIELLRAEQALLRREGWQERESYDPDRVAYESEDVYTTLTVRSEDIYASRVAKVVARLHRADRPVLIATLVPRRE